MYLKKKKKQKYFELAHVPFGAFITELNPTITLKSNII
jgi:hypothetical protein